MNHGGSYFADFVFLFPLSPLFVVQTSSSALKDERMSRARCIQREMICGLSVKESFISTLGFICIFVLGQNRLKEKNLTMVRVRKAVGAEIRISLWIKMSLENWPDPKP